MTRCFAPRILPCGGWRNERRGAGGRQAMSDIPDDLKYSADHVWIRIDDEYNGRCGITDHWQELLDAIIFVELPEEDSYVKQGETVGTIESSSATAGVIAPVSG